MLWGFEGLLKSRRYWSTALGEISQSQDESNTDTSFCTYPCTPLFTRTSRSIVFPAQQCTFDKIPAKQHTSHPRDTSSSNFLKCKNERCLIMHFRMCRCFSAWIAPQCIRKIIRAGARVSSRIEYIKTKELDTPVGIGAARSTLVCCTRCAGKKQRQMARSN